MDPQRRISAIANHVVCRATSAHTSLPSAAPKEKASAKHVWQPKPEPGTVALVGAPLCEGQTLGGVNKAPGAFRDNGLEKVVRGLKWSFADFGDVPRAVDVALPANLGQSDGLYFEDSAVKNCTVVGAGVGAVHDRVFKAAEEGRFVLTIGGDHSIAAGSISAIHKHRPDLAVVWVDAHGDCNTPMTSPSGNYHGMPLAHILGWFEKRVKGFEWCHDYLQKHGPLEEDRVALIALRDVDPTERELLQSSGIHVFTMTDIDRYGIGPIMDEALRRIDPKGRRPLHLSFDIDSCDPTVAPGTGTKSRGGLSYREAHYICESLATTGRLGSMDLVEVNPAIDNLCEERMHGDDPDIKGTETVRLGIELVGSALGKSII